MYEFEVLEDDSTDIIFGYSYEDALRRFWRNPEEVVRILHQEYVD